MLGALALVNLHIPGSLAPCSFPTVHSGRLNLTRCGSVGLNPEFAVVYSTHSAYVSLEREMVQRMDMDDA